MSCIAVKPLPEQDYLRYLFTYNPDTGIFTRNVRLGGRASVGQVVGAKTSYGHLTTNIMGTAYLLHRLAWKMYYGVDPKYIDHINGVPTDNRIENLRDVEFKVNYKNQKRRSTRSGYMGVSKRTGYEKWRVRITSEGRLINVGDFDSFEDAVKARKDAEVRYGFHENHNRIKP